MTGEPTCTTSKERCHTNYKNQFSDLTHAPTINSALFSTLFHPLYSISNGEHYKKCLCNQSSHYRNNNSTHAQTISYWEVNDHLFYFHFCSTHYSIINKEQHECHFYNQPSYYVNYDNSCDKKPQCISTPTR